MTKQEKSHFRSSENTLNPASANDAKAPLLVRERGWGEGVSDHLGSTNITLDASGNKIAELRYMPWGSQRYSSGSTPTDYRYTGQRSEPELGLYFYQARWYDDTLGRFTQPDTLIPDPNNPLDYDRYAYVRNNPLTYTDPSGHDPDANDDVPPVTYDEEHGLCINTGDYIYCSGTKESNIDWIEWNISMLPYEWDQRWLSEQWWSDVSVGFTDLAYATSSVGAGVEATLTGLGAGAGTFGATVGAITGNVIHQTFINPLETIFSSAATLSTIRADTLSGSLGVSSTSGTVIVDISETTVTAIGSQSIGNANPIGVVDALIDGYAFSYSHGNAPGLLSAVGLSNKTITIGPITIRFGQ